MQLRDWEGETWKEVEGGGFECVETPGNYLPDYDALSTAYGPLTELEDE